MTNTLARSTNSIIGGPKSAKSSKQTHILIAITLDDSSKCSTMMIEKQLTNIHENQRYDLYKIHKYWLMCACSITNYKQISPLTNCDHPTKHNINFVLMQNNERLDSRTECVSSLSTYHHLSSKSNYNWKYSCLKYTHSHIKVEKTLRRRTIAAATECVP